MRYAPLKIPTTSDYLEYLGEPLGSWYWDNLESVCCLSTDLAGQRAIVRKLCVACELEVPPVKSLHHIPEFYEVEDGVTDGIFVFPDPVLLGFRSWVPVHVIYHEVAHYWEWCAYGPFAGMNEDYHSPEYCQLLKLLVRDHGQWLKEKI